MLRINRARDHVNGVARPIEPILLWICVFELVVRKKTKQDPGVPGYLLVS
jgi:hypothetical protein